MNGKTSQQIFITCDRNAKKDKRNFGIGLFVTASGM